MYFKLLMFLFEEMRIAMLLIKILVAFLKKENSKDFIYKRPTDWKEKTLFHRET